MKMFDQLFVMLAHTPSTTIMSSISTHYTRCVLSITIVTTHCEYTPQLQAKMQQSSLIVRMDTITFHC